MSKAKPPKPLNFLLGKFNEARTDYVDCIEMSKADQVNLAKALNKAHAELDKAIHKMYCEAFDE